MAVDANDLQSTVVAGRDWIAVGVVVAGGGGQKSARAGGGDLPRKFCEVFLKYGPFSASLAFQAKVWSSN